MTTDKFKSLTTWQLEHGSHEFPGPHGGTCINEAALVVAGLAYREVTSVADLPESFCPVVSQYALTLNDALPEGELLNRLLPFAMRLSGSSNGRRTAGVRSAYLALQAATAFAPLAVQVVNPLAARALKNVADEEAALVILDALDQTGWSDDVRAAAGAAQRALARTIHGKDPIFTADLAAICARRAGAVDDNVWPRAIEVLDRVLAIGKQADPIETGLIEQRAAELLAAS